MTSPTHDETSQPSDPTSPPATETAPPIPSSPFFSPTARPPADTTTDPWSDPQTESPSPLEPDADPASPSRSASKGRAKLRALRESIKGAVQTAGGVAHQLLTREGTPEREAGLYLPDADDVKAISEPLAGLASRRAPEAASNPDVADLIGLVVGLAGYAIKQQLKRAELARQHFLEGTLDEHDPDAPAEPVNA